MLGKHMFVDRRLRD